MDDEWVRCCANPFCRGTLPPRYRHTLYIGRTQLEFCTAGCARSYRRNHDRLSGRAVAASGSFYGPTGGAIYDRGQAGAHEEAETQSPPQHG